MIWSTSENGRENSRSDLGEISEKNFRFEKKIDFQNYPEYLSLIFNRFI